jgi:hypothetical protein
VGWEEEGLWGSSQVAVRDAFGGDGLYRADAIVAGKGGFLGEEAYGDEVGM